MTTRSPRERVMEAVTKGLELVAELNDAKAKVTMAKTDEDEVRLADRTKEIADAANARLLEQEQAAKTAFDAGVAEARKPLDLAQTRFDQAYAGLCQRRDREIAQASQKAAEIIQSAQQAQATKAAIAKAGVHTAQQEVNNQEAGLDRYARQVEQQLGVNLKQLLAIAKE